MTATFLVPRVPVSHWTKRLARRVGVPHETARHWVYYGASLQRFDDIAAAILAECNELERLIADTRRELRAQRAANGRETTDDAFAVVGEESNRR